jgi:hypothetical protein
MLNILEGRSQLDLAALGEWGVVNILVQVDRDFDSVFRLDPISKYVNSFVHECSPRTANEYLTISASPK